MTTYNPEFVQAQNFTLSGSGALIGDTSVILTSFKAIDGVTNLVIGDFGTVGYLTIDPNNGSSEEQISFTGITNNANGTATLTGVKTVLFKTPYTETSGLAKTHNGGAIVAISNTAGFYKQLKNYIDQVGSSGAAPASTTVQGVGLISVAPANAAIPIFTGTNDPRVPVAYAVDSVGTDAYAITPSPAITAYIAGQHFTFKAGTANTGAATLNVNGLGAKTIKKAVSTDLVTGDILVGQIVDVVYDGTNMQVPILSSIANIVRTYNLVDSPATWTKPTGLTYIEVELWGGGGSGGCKSVSSPSSGGGGGAYFKGKIPAASLGATVTVTIGAGGIGGSTDNSGNVGGNTTFGTFFTAYGGGKGPNGSVGGGGGGQLSNGGISGVGGNPTGGAATGVTSYAGGGGGGSSGTGGAAVLGGGGGGGDNGTGGTSIWGGGGGGNANAGGTSVFGGAGGAGSGGGAGTAGSVPGGGGGGNGGVGNLAGNGGAGRAVITEYYT